MENLYKEVLKEVDHLVAMIEQSEEYQTYRSLEDKMFQNKELMRVIREIKKKEQELAKKEQFGTSSEKEKKRVSRTDCKIRRISYLSRISNSPRGIKRPVPNNSSDTKSLFR